VAQECNDYLAREGYPWVYRSFNCLDQLLQKFMARVESLGLANDTEVLILGDHQTMGNVASVLGAERNLTLFLPLRPQDRKWKQGHKKKMMTYYDIAPTILSMLNIEYYPPFPFGSDLFGPTVGQYASEQDLKVIYGLVTGDIDARGARCHTRSGLCQGNEH
jgi:phosphoglycerol transferase MdoB-like AlkP superfamily enzyme